MSKLDDLINKLCPDGVEYKTLGEIGKVCMCKRIMKNQTESTGDIPFYKIGTFGKKADAFISRELFEEYKSKFSFPKKGYILISASGTIGRTVIYNGEPAYYQDSNIVWIDNDETEVTNKWLYYCYQTSPWQVSTGGTIARLYNDNIAKAIIPVPPLEVQNEIVRILDKFTSLEAELEAELEARRKQYEYYRDSLLTFGVDVEWKALGEIATDIYRGSGIKRDQVTSEGIPCVRYGEIYTSYNIHFNDCISHTIIDNVPSPKYFEHGDILFAITGESVEDIAKSIAYMGNEKCLAGGDIVVLKHNQNPKYLSFALSTNDAIMQKGKGKVKSKVVHSSVPSISEIKIPIPDLETQEKIANILDNFLQLTNNITSGLPAEIEARHKQYEYYRDKLLSFKHKEG